MKSVIQALALDESADEAVVLAAVKKLQVSARIGGEIEKLVGATGDAALGAVRALKESQTQQAELAAEVEKLKITNARRDFDDLIKQGRVEKKNLTPHAAKEYTEKFEAAVASGGDVVAIVEQLRSFVALALPRTAPGIPPTGSAVGGDDPVMKWRDKTFAELAPVERHQLKSEDPDLYALMRRDWEAGQNR